MILRRLCLMAFFAGSFWVTPAWPVLGELAATRLLTLFPAGGKVGSTVEVVITGQDLEEVKELRFSHGAISAQTNGTNKFTVSIPDSVQPGTYDVRVVGKNGASNPRLFSVGLLAELGEEKQSAESPQNVSLPSTVNGRTEANTIDYFRFTAKKGERILVRCEAQELESKLEPVITLLDVAGRESGRSRSGGVLDHRVREDGELQVRLHDVLYRGGPEYFYRLSIGTFPHIDFVLPIATADNGKTKYAIYGRNLLGGKAVEGRPGLEQIEREISLNDPGLRPARPRHPAQAGLDLMEYRVKNDQGISQPIILLLPDARVVSEDEPNSTAATAQKITLPCEIAGQFYPKRDRDWFTFEAKKGESYWIELISARLGLPTDPFLVVQRVTTNGASDVLEMNDFDSNLGGVEFNTTSRDPSAKLEVKEDGVYRLQVRDLFTQAERNLALVYQLKIRPATPDFKLVALPPSPLPSKKDAKDLPISTTTLRRGETMPIKVVAFRREGFTGPIELSIEGLPPGLSALGSKIEAGKNAGVILLQAKEDAGSLITKIKILGKAEVAGASVTREAQSVNLSWGVTDPANEPVLSRGNDEYLVSMTGEMAPMRIVSAEEKTWETNAGAKIKIPLRIERDGEFTANFKLKPYGLPALESAAEIDVDGKSTNAVFDLDLSKQKLEPGSYYFTLQGIAHGKPMKIETTGKKVPDKETAVTLYSAPIHLKVNPAPTAPANAAAK